MYTIDVLRSHQIDESPRPWEQIGEFRTLDAALVELRSRERIRDGSEYALRRDGAMCDINGDPLA